MKRMRLLAPLSGLAVLMLSSLAFADPPAGAPAAAEGAPPAPPLAPAAVPGAPMAPWVGPPPGYAPPSWWAPPPSALVPERRSPGMMITGATLFGLGATATTAGGVLLGLLITHPCVDAGQDVPVSTGPSPGGAAHRGDEHIRAAGQALSACDGGLVTVAFGLIVAGAATGVAGVPFYVVGARRVPPKAYAPASAVPEIKVGLGGGSLRWTF
jgi:hypothetical protein